MLLSLIIILLSVGIDQLTKYLASTYLYGSSVTVIPHVLDFSYVENRGAAFGMLADNRWVFLIISTVMIAAIGVYLFAAKHPSVLERVSLALIVGGGIGNMIDRVASGYVVDFIDVTFVKFYVFNIADSCVCVGCGLMVIWCIADSLRDAKRKKAGVTVTVEVPTEVVVSDDTADKVPTDAGVSDDIADEVPTEADGAAAEDNDG